MFGFDVHKETISFWAKAQDGRILDEGTIAARRTERVVQSTATGVGGSAGSDLVYGMDLRSLEAFGAGGSRAIVLGFDQFWGFCEY